MGDVKIADLWIETTQGVPILKGINLNIREGEILGLVGESGSGKSTLGLALLGFTKPGLQLRSGSVSLSEQEVLPGDPSVAKLVRGKQVSYVPQNPGTSLNPMLSIGEQLAEVIPSDSQRANRVGEALVEVGLPDDSAFLSRKPTELSGGQQQRVAIAMAVIGRPQVVVLDEPTTGLDVTTQMLVLDLVSQITKRHRMSAIYISHDLGVVGHVSERIVVLRDGLLVEENIAANILGNPQESYSKQLISAVPSLESYRQRQEREIEPQSPPLFSASNVRARYGKTEVLHGINLTVEAGECVAIVGESGSGKSTLSRCLIGLHPESSGKVQFKGTALTRSSRGRSVESQRRVQYIFQNPYASIQPKRMVGDSVATAIRRFERLSKTDLSDAVRASLRRVSLDPNLAHRYPAELSGGQLQRVAIARSIAVEPQFLICDEVTSALDVSVQASILELLTELQESGLGMLFITHNLAVVSSIADKILVLKEGTVVEEGRTETVLGAPKDLYTRTLLENTLDIDPYRQVQSA